MNGLLIGIIIGIVMAGAVGSLLLAMRGQGADAAPASLRSSSDGEWRWRIGTSEMDWSERLFEILRIAPGSIQPSWEKFKELIDPEDRERYESLVDEAVKKGLPFKIEFRVLLPTGEALWVESSGVPDASGGDAPIYLAGSVTDITEIKTLMIERDDLRAQLETRDRSSEAPAPQPTSVETTEAPAPAAVMCESSPALLKIAQDLNNFLTGILGWSQLLERQDGNSPETKRCVEGIRENSKQANDRIKRLYSVLASPSQEIQEPRRHTEHSASTAAAGSDSGVSSARVLFVDDQPLVVDLFVDMAKVLGFGCFGYTDPEAALTSLQDRPDEFDVLICDLQMPSMSGQELLEQALIIKPSLVTVISSGLRAESEDGAQPHLLLQKPYSLDTLKETIESALRIKSGEAG